VAAAILAGDVVLLTLFLNPDVTLVADGPALVLCLFLPYLAAGTLALWLLALLVAALPPIPRVPRPPVEGMPWFTILALAAVGAAAALFWSNLFAYRHSLPESVLPPLAGSAVALTAAALVLGVVATDTALFPARARGVSPLLVVLAAAAALVFPLAVRPRPSRPPAPVPVATERVTPARRLIVVGVDGLDLAQLRTGIARGELAGFASVLRRGAHGPLATLRPTEAPPIWTTIYTGRLPRDHGVKSFSSYRLRGSRTTYDLLPKGAFVTLLERARLVSRTPVTSAARRRRALWNVLNAFEIPAGVVRVWATHPPEQIQAFMVSPYFHALAAQDRGEAAVHPQAAEAELGARLVTAADVDRALVGEFVDPAAAGEGDDARWRRELVEQALAPDLTYQRAGDALRAAYDPPFFATYFYGLDVVGHAFTRYADPDAFGDVSPDEGRRFGRVRDAYAAWIGRAVGDMAEGLRPGEILLVVSGYGMRAVPPWRRAWNALAGGATPSGTHAGAPDGVLLAIGDGIRPGATLKASVLDLTPTMLYLMGLPVARDMEGRVITEMLQDDFTRAHPVTFIPSYESLAVTPTTGETDTGLPPLPEEGS
jgi:predicted AlkP superfamily phosphohydrolase/phosphomutase